MSYQVLVLDSSNGERPLVPIGKIVPRLDRDPEANVQSCDLVVEVWRELSKLTRNVDLLDFYAVDLSTGQLYVQVRYVDPPRPVCWERVR